MKTRVIFYIRYYLFWLLFYVIQKPVFMLCQQSQMGDVKWYDCFFVMWHGLPLDLSVAGYLTVIPALLLILSVWIQERRFQRITAVYSWIFIIVSWVVIIADNGTFPYWGFRLDKTVFIYLVSPKEVLASASWWVWITGCVVLCSGVWITWIIYKKAIYSVHLENCEGVGKRVLASVLLFVLSAFLFLPIRGSLTVSTMNTGRVYYSPNRILNISAINPAFNLIESLSEQTFDLQRYTYMPQDEADNIVKQMVSPLEETSTYDTFLKTNRPNVVLIIWESMSANGWLAMPQTRKLAEEGIWFTNAYASSFRTDRGVVAVLSGFPGQPTSSLMTAPGKTKSLNYVSRDLQDNGYQLYWYYGGDEDFTNMRSYLTYAGFDNRVCDKSFPLSDRMSKWGVPDHILFDYCQKTIAQRKADSVRCFDVILTLSSHEPFEVPAKRRYDDIYLNSLAYTDSCVGAFADSLKMMPQWDSTLLVIMGDHGFPYPQGVQNHEPRRYATPVIIAGGAVKSPMKSAKVCSQIDWIPTVLNAMGIRTDKYIFSKNILSDNTDEWAFYSYNDGWGVITKSDTTVYDRVAEKNVIESDNSELREKQGKAMVQTIYYEIEKLSSSKK